MVTSWATLATVCHSPHHWTLYCSPALTEKTDSLGNLSLHGPDFCCKKVSSEERWEWDSFVSCSLGPGYARQAEDSLWPGIPHAFHPGTNSSYTCHPGSCSPQAVWAPSSSAFQVQNEEAHGTQHTVVMGRKCPQMARADHRGDRQKRGCPTASKLSK